MGCQYVRLFAIYHLFYLTSTQAYEDMGKLSYVMAVFMETMRMFPSVRLASLTVVRGTQSNENNGRSSTYPNMQKKIPLYLRKTWPVRS